ncbi:MAG TPA: glycosyltransferase, partial [Candidatus Saccharimonadales bacterium]|nr:glycosyltransferase [Candidatus Saccharimonadales bacterium]
FAGSGGASLHRVDMLRQIGLFDEDFFAYYEDVDLSFRAQLSGWKVKYVPTAVVKHQIGATSGKVKGFTTYQTLKNLPLLLVKNVPTKYLFKVAIRFKLAYLMFVLRSLSRLQFLPVIKGLSMTLMLLPKAISKRRHIQNTRVVPDEYIWSMIIHDLPPNARSLRLLRSKWWSLRGKHE